MRIVLKLAIVSFVAYSCSVKKQSIPSQIVEVYSPDDFFTKKIPEKGFKVIDTFCINETQRAERDIKNGNLFLHNNYLDYHNSYIVKRYFFGSPKKSVIQELSKFNITIDTVYIPNLYNLYGNKSNYFKNNCYQQIMKIEIDRLLANHSLSIDTLIKRAERHYVLDHPDEIYLLHDADRSLELPNEYQASFYRIKSELTEKFIYPGDYKYKSEAHYSYTTADFILMKDGTIKDLEVKAIFQNPYNNKFREYFEKELRDFVLTTKWVHPTSSGIIVNSEMSFSFHHK